MPQAYATPADVRGPEGGPAGGVAPQFTALTDAQVQIWLDVAAQIIGLGWWGTRASYAHALLTAHLLASLAGEDGSGVTDPGLLASEADGPASRSFAHFPPTDADLGTTSFGRAYLLLRRVARGRGTYAVAGMRRRT